MVSPAARDLPFDRRIERQSIVERLAEDIAIHQVTLAIDVRLAVRCLAGCAAAGKLAHDVDIHCKIAMYISDLKEVSTWQISAARRRPDPFLRRRICNSVSEPETNDQK
jgi:hypothetical protein